MRPVCCGCASNAGKRRRCILPLTNDIVDPVRSSNCSAIRFEFDPGGYVVQTFEVYTMQYFNLIVTEGTCEAEPLAWIEYKHPPVFSKRWTIFAG